MRRLNGVRLLMLLKLLPLELELILEFETHLLYFVYVCDSLLLLFIRVCQLFHRQLVLHALKFSLLLQFLHFIGE